MTERVLAKHGFDVVAVRDGAEALDAAGSAPFDAIVMDCQMPVMDGFQATTAIRAHERSTGAGRTPIIGLSGRSMEGDRENALERGMDAYLTKPVNARRLRAVLDSWISGDRTDDGAPPIGA